MPHAIEFCLLQYQTIVAAKPDPHKARLNQTEGLVRIIHSTLSTLKDHICAPLWVVYYFWVDYCVICDLGSHHSYKYTSVAKNKR